MEKEKNKKTMLIVGAVVVVVILVVIIAVALGGKDSKKGDKDSSKNGEEITEKEKDGIKSYGSYGNYKLVTTASLVTKEDFKVDVVNDMSIDVKNNVIKSTITTVGLAQYFYFDIANKISYYSLDNKGWSKNSPVEMLLPDFSVLLGKVQKGTGVTKNGDNTYKFTTDVEFSGETIKDIPVTITFDNNGYISKIVYEVSSTREDAKSYNVTYELSEVGTAPNVEIPTSIIQNSTSGNEATIISFYK